MVAHAQSKALNESNVRECISFIAISFFKCSFIGSDRCCPSKIHGPARIGLHWSQRSTEYTAMPTCCRFRAIMISLELHNVLVLGRSRSVVSLVVAVLHMHARLFLAHSSFPLTKICNTVYWTLVQ